MTLTKLVLHGAAIFCFALGALAQTDGTPDNRGTEDNSTAKAAAAAARNALKACKSTCETTGATARTTCRQEGTRCFSQATDLMLEILAPRQALCDPIKDATARGSCRLAAVGWAISQTASTRQVCSSARATCLNDADDAESTCVDRCDSMYASAPPQP